MTYASKYGLAARYHATASRMACSRALPADDRLMGVAAMDCSKASNMASASARKAALRRLPVDFRYARAKTPSTSSSTEIGVSTELTVVASNMPTAQLGAGYRNLNFDGLRQFAPRVA